MIEAGRGGERPRGRAAGPQLARRGPDGARAPARAGRRDRRLRGARGRRRARALPLVRPDVALGAGAARRPLGGRETRCATRRSRSPPRPRTRWRRGSCARSTTARSRSAGSYARSTATSFVEMAAASAEPWAWLTFAVYIDARGRPRGERARRRWPRCCDGHQPAGHRQLARGGRPVARRSAMLGDRDGRRAAAHDARAERAAVPGRRARRHLHRLRAVLRGAPREHARPHRRGRAAAAPRDHREPADRRRPARRDRAVPARRAHGRPRHAARGRRPGGRVRHARRRASAPAPPPTPRWPTPRNPSGSRAPARPGRAGSPAARRRAPRR